MSGLSTKPTQPHQVAGARTSPWAIGSVAASLLICCPLLTILGPIMGWKALQDIDRNPQRTGAKLARFGITLGLLTTAISLGGMAWWHLNVRQPMLVGPRAALRAGFAGDLDGFRAGFGGHAAELPDEEALQFLSELASRYGRFLNSRQDEMREAVGTVAGGLTIPYVLTFESGEVRAQARFVVWDAQNAVPSARFASIVIIDSSLGHVAYPADAVSLAPSDDLQPNP